MTLMQVGIGASSEVDFAWPREVGLILSAMEAGSSAVNRREMPRHSYQVLARLRLFTDDALSPRRVLYSRDVNPRSLGFITEHRLPLGYGGAVELSLPCGRMVSIHCTLLRCRQAAPGWFEGALYFNRERWEFDLDPDRDHIAPLISQHVL